MKSLNAMKKMKSKGCNDNYDPAPRCVDTIDIFENTKDISDNARIGTQIRKRRRYLKLTQQQVADQLGVRYQQIQKYETGTNRISAAALFKLSTFLQVPMNYFFGGELTMKNKLTDLNNHLFAQIERLSDESISQSEIEKEAARAEAIVSVSEQIIKNADLSLKAAKFIASQGGQYDAYIPLSSNKNVVKLEGKNNANKEDPYNGRTY